MSFRQSCEEFLFSLQQRLLTKLRRGIEENCPKVIQQCIKHGLNLNATTPGSGLTPLELALQKRNMPMFKALLDAGANPGLRNGQGASILQTAIKLGCLECVKLLVEYGANLYERSSEGMTSLDAARKKEELFERDDLSHLQNLILADDVDLILSLKSRGVNFNTQFPDGTVPVFFATKHCKNKALKGLLEAGADPNIETKYGNFALHEAVKHRDVEVVRLLLQHGADRDTLDIGGMTPLEVAEELVPPPQDIIHCLLTDCMDNEEAEVSRPAEDHVENDRKMFDDEMEQSLCCPITFEIMKDPVIAADGHTYEREAIEQWIREKRQSPVTRQPMTSVTLIPNLAIKHLIDQFPTLYSHS